MNHVAQFFSKLTDKAKEYRDRARDRFYGRSSPMRENGACRSSINFGEDSRSRDWNDQSSFSDYKTPAMFASTGRLIQRIVKTSASRVASSFRTPSEIWRDEKSNWTFCGRKIDWDQVSVDGDDDSGEARQEFWSEKRHNGTYHLDQLSVKSEWNEQAFFTPKEFPPNRLSPQNAFSKEHRHRQTFPRTSSLLDVSKVDHAHAPESPDFSPGRTFDIPCSESFKRKISLPPSLKNMLNSTDLSLETNSPNESNSLSEDKWMSLEWSELGSNAQGPMFNSSKIDQGARVDKMEKTDEVDFEPKSHSVHDSGLGNRSSLISNDAAMNNEHLNTKLGEFHDDEKFWKKGRVGISRWYSFENKDDLCLSPLSKDA